MNKLWFGVTILVLAVAGVFDATYLTAKYFLHQEVVCSLFSGCNQVLGSRFAHIGPMPLSLLGVIYYFLVLILCGLYLQYGSVRAMSLIFGIVSGGLAVSLILVGLQIVVIHAICMFCMFSAIITLAMFLISWKLKQIYEL